MEYVEVQGRAVPALGMGTWRLTGAACQRSIETGLGIGYRHIDTAQAYGNEAEVGAGIAASGVDPSELFVTTKLDSDNLEPDMVVKSTNESLEQLQLDAIDLLLIHQPSRLDILEQTLEAMQRVVTDGLVRSLGVSNFARNDLERALGAAELLAIQIEYHTLREQHEQLRAARRHGLLFQAYSPLARGGIIDDPEVKAVASDVGATPAQVALRWLMNHPFVAAIPKATSAEHLEDNWGALDITLDDHALARLDAASTYNREAADVGT